MDLIKKHIISVCFTTQCNYNCEYCVSPKIFEKTFIDINKLYIFIQNILCYTEILQINIEGDGEPTLHPQLFDFCEKINNNTNIYINILTNFSKPVEYYYKFLKFKNVKFILSWHSLLNDKYNKEFFIKLNKFKNAKNIIKHINIVFEPKNADVSLLMYKMCYYKYSKTLKICYPIDKLYTNDEILKFNTIKTNFQSSIKSCQSELCYINSNNYIYKCYTHYIINNSPLMSLDLFNIITLFKITNCNINFESCYT